jgi:uncharacterized protein YndB with AHSA1/START domain
MSEILLEFDQVFPAPRQRVFDFFADHEKLGRLWGGRWKVLRPGNDPASPHGLGSIREIRMGAFKFEETITAFRPHDLIEYQITGGGEVRNHHARISFSDAPGGTRVEYRIRWEPKAQGAGEMIAATLRLAWTVGVHKVIREFAGSG